MKPHVKNVLDLWRQSISEIPERIQPYKISEQLKNFAALFAPGNFYYYILNYPKLEMEYVHDGTMEVLGIPAKEVTLANLVENLLPKERETMARKEAVVVDFFMNFLNPDQAMDYKSVYFFRVCDREGQIHHMLHQASILTMTPNNEPEYVMVVHTDVSHLSFFQKEEVSFVNLRGNKSYLEVSTTSGSFDPKNSKRREKILKGGLSLREKEIVKLLGQGKGADEISDELNISVHTVRTHRKNLLKKARCRNTAEVVAKCLVEGVI